MLDRTRWWITEIMWKLGSLCRFPNVVAERHIFGGVHPRGYDYHPSPIILCLLVMKLSCWQTNKQTDAAENIQRSSLRYDFG